MTQRQDFNEYFFHCNILDGEIYNALFVKWKNLKKNFKINYCYRSLRGIGTHKIYYLVELNK